MMIREKLRIYFESAGFQRIIVTLIVINSLLIGIETYPEVMDRFGFFIDQLDRVILVLFVIELGLKLYAFGGSFFTSVWNIFDALVILVSVVPSAGSFSVLRALRIVRTLRLLKNIPKLKIIIESLLHAVPSIGWITVLLLIVFYIFGVIGTNLFGIGYPEYFGSLGKSFFTLFQIMTLESWSSAIARPILEGAPFAAVYFVSFILIATYTTLNIFIAIVVNTMNELHQRDIMEEEEHIKAFVTKENAALHQRFSELDEELKATRKELKETLNLLKESSLISRDKL